jgi:hypothetical protein
MGEERIRIPLIFHPLLAVILSLNGRRANKMIAWCHE